MSDTPRTDGQTQFFGWNPDEGEEFVIASFARQLERENAALRAALIRIHTAWVNLDGSLESEDELDLAMCAAIDAAKLERGQNSFAK
mgnify:CR=1 FL=1